MVASIVNQDTFYSKVAYRLILLIIGSATFVLCLAAVAPLMGEGSMWKVGPLTIAFGFSYGVKAFAVKYMMQSAVLVIGFILVGYVLSMVRGAMGRFQLAFWIANPWSLAVTTQLVIAGDWSSLSRRPFWVWIDDAFFETLDLSLVCFIAVVLGGYLAERFHVRDGDGNAERRADGARHDVIRPFAAIQRAVLLLAIGALLALFLNIIAHSWLSRLIVAMVGMPPVAKDYFASDFAGAIRLELVSFFLVYLGLAIPLARVWKGSGLCGAFFVANPWLMAFLVMFYRPIVAQLLQNPLLRTPTRYNIYLFDLEFYLTLACFLGYLIGSGVNRKLSSSPSPVAG